ncbi:hypothetical protein D2S45_07030 [Prevotella intermedia]|uniref:Uncharacterized protein n=1 Tax=Prevotella intermedia TaxID=28131 RepID=A0A3R8N4K8_PREIN|nr:hypothetical protein D2S53_06790 [Prevotella intermedia]RRF87246.1 hypothetical protein D2S45_07030 [Prevotella intermedia]
MLVVNALQNLLFCVPKAAVLHGKSVGFASQNSRFRNVKSKLPFFFRIIFTKQERFPICLSKESKSSKNTIISKESLHLRSSIYPTKSGDNSITALLSPQFYIGL